MTKPMTNCALRIFWSFAWRSLLVLVPVKLALRYFWSFVWVWFRDDIFAGPDVAYWLWQLYEAVGPGSWWSVDVVIALPVQAWALWAALRRHALIEARK